ncbi:MAG: hypothetical protein ACYC8T_24895 [Myxococcaceae bacterium]
MRWLAILTLVLLLAGCPCSPKAPAPPAEPSVAGVEGHGGIEVSPPLDRPVPAVAFQDPKVVFQMRFGDADLAMALLLYMEGGAEAVGLLKEPVPQPEKAALHSQAEAVRRQILSVRYLHEEGERLLEAGDIEGAAVPLREALEVDKKLMGELFERTPSYHRTRILHDMASSAYEAGKLLADRGDMKKACHVWRLGFAFYKGNAELLRALGNVCSPRASQALEAAASCEDLQKVLDFAVDGDGTRKKVADLRAARECP